MAVKAITGIGPCGRGESMSVCIYNIYYIGYLVYYIFSNTQVCYCDEISKNNKNKIERKRG